MMICFLTCLCFFAWIKPCTGQPVFNCPRPVAYGDSAVLKCSMVHNLIVFIKNPDDEQVGGCTRGICEPIDGEHEKINFTRIDNSTVHLTVQTIGKEDDGLWTCESGSTASCSLNVYKLPSCEISSTSSTNDLTIGQDLTLNITLSDYYCTNSIAWNLHIGDRYQNITELRDQEETENITSRVVSYSPVVTSSLTGRVELAYNCNDETYDVSCSGVTELKLRDPPSCKLTSVNNTEDLTTGGNLTLNAEIEEYPCTRGIEYALLSGSLMVTDFVKNDTSFYAKFEVRPEYLGKKLYLYYSCNKVSATTMTTGVGKLLNKGAIDNSHNKFELIIGLTVSGIVSIGIIVIVVVICIRKRKKSKMKDVPYADVHDTVPGRSSSLKVTNNDTYTEVSDITGSLKRNHFEANGVNEGLEKSLGTGCVEGTCSHMQLIDLKDASNSRERHDMDRSRPKSECVMVPNVVYESADRILPKHAKENRSLQNGTEDYYAKVDKHRSHDNGYPDVLASARV